MGVADSRVADQLPRNVLDVPTLAVQLPRRVEGGCCAMATAVSASASTVHAMVGLMIARQSGSLP